MNAFGQFGAEGAVNTDSGRDVSANELMEQQFHNSQSSVAAFLDFEKNLHGYPGIQALLDYDAVQTSAEIDSEVWKFVNRLFDAWQGRKKQYERLFQFHGIIRRILLFGIFVSAVVWFTSWVIEPWVTSKLGVSPHICAALIQAATIALLLIIASIMDMIFSYQAGDITNDLRDKITEHIEKTLKDELHDKLVALPTSGTTESVADCSIIHFLGVSRKWRELDRTPQYIAFRWINYRTQAADGRANKLKWLGAFAMVWVVAIVYSLLNSNFIEAWAMQRAAWLPHPLHIVGLWPIEYTKTIGFSISAYSLIDLLIFSFLVSVIIFKLFRWRFRKLLFAINDGLSVGTSIYESGKATHTESLFNWHSRVATMDPTPKLAKKYAQVLDAFIGCTNS